MIENLWHVLKHHCIPPEIAADMPLMEEYLLSYLHTSHCTEDPFADLGRAVRDYMAHFGGEPLKKLLWQKAWWLQVLQRQATPRRKLILQHSILAFSRRSCLQLAGVK